MRLEELLAATSNTFDLIHFFPTWRGRVHHRRHLLHNWRQKVFFRNRNEVMRGVANFTYVTRATWLRTFQCLSARHLLGFQIYLG